MVRQFNERADIPVSRIVEAIAVTVDKDTNERLLPANVRHGVDSAI